MFSERVSVHFTGRPSTSAAFAATAYSTYMPALAPKPPPTAGATTRTCSSLEPGRRRDRLLDAVRSLGRARSTASPPSPSGSSDDPVRLHRHRREPLVHEPPLHHELGAVEDRRVLAEVELDREVRAVLGEQQRRAVGERRLGVDHHGQRLVVRRSPARPRRPPAPGSPPRPRRRRRRRSGPGPSRRRGRLKTGGHIDEALDRREVEVVTRVDRDDAGHARRLRRCRPRATSAWAIVDRTNTTCSSPSMARSSKYLAPPSRIAGSSRRSTAWPRIDPDAVMRAPALVATAAIYLRVPTGRGQATAAWCPGPAMNRRTSSPITRRPSSES